MQEIKNQEESENIFRNIELAGERFKQEFKELAIQAQATIDAHVNISKFEAAYALAVSKRQRVQTMKEVKEVRNELWQKSLKKANGNVSDAFEIYEKLCAFP